MLNLKKFWVEASLQTYHKHQAQEKKPWALWTIYNEQSIEIFSILSIEGLEKVLFSNS